MNTAKVRFSTLSFGFLLLVIQACGATAALAQQTQPATRPSEASVDATRTIQALSEENARLRQKLDIAEVERAKARISALKLRRAMRAAALRIEETRAILAEVQSALDGTGVDGDEPLRPKPIVGTIQDVRNDGGRMKGKLSIGSKDGVTAGQMFQIQSNGDYVSLFWVEAVSEGESTGELFGSGAAEARGGMSARSMPDPRH